MLSCNSKKNVMVELSVDKSDSVLNIAYSNMTSKNFVIDLTPEINDSKYEIYPEGGTSFNIILEEISINSEDSLFYERKKFNYLNKYKVGKGYSYPIFIKSNSKKVYKFKIKNYISGKKITCTTPKDLFDALYEDMERSGSKEILDTLQNLKQQKYDGFEYFTGTFSFKKNKIELP